MVHGYILIHFTFITFYGYYFGSWFIVLTVCKWISKY